MFTPMFGRLAALAVLGTGAATASPQPAGPAVQLLRWDTPAIERTTPSGPTFFYLRAAVAWGPSASEEPGAYRTQIVLPDGRVEVRSLYRDQGPGLSDGLSFLVPVEAVRNLPPERVKVVASVVDGAGVQVSGSTLTADSDQFPLALSPAGPKPEMRDWPAALAGRPGTAELLPAGLSVGEGVSPLRFVRVFPADPSGKGFFLASTEVSMAQVNAAQAGITYAEADLTIGESRVTLEAPAYRLTPKQALAYLEALGKADGLGLAYRLPTREEWTYAARAGRPTRFWWGDDPASPQVHFRGNPAPRAGVDVVGRPDEVIVGPSVSLSLMGYRSNPFGLWHTFGNVTEWATETTTAGPVYWKLGGSFATESADFRESDLAIRVEGADTLTGAGEEDPPQWVGVRPAADITAEQGATIVKRRLAEDPASGRAEVSYDPRTAVATIRGTVPTWADVLAADRLLARVDSNHPSLWFVASVVNQLQPPGLADGHLAELGEPVGPVRVRFEVGYWFYDVPLPVRWAPRLPVEGSSWWVVGFRPGGERVLEHRLPAAAVGSREPVLVTIPGRALAGAGIAAGSPIEVSLALGVEPPAYANDPAVVSNRRVVQWDPARVPLPQTAAPTPVFPQR